jgi:type IV pilus assembly protein PilZ
MDGADKRQAERAAITLRVDYKRLNTFFADYTKNISKGGTFIKTLKPLDVGTEFVFVLSVPAKLAAAEPEAPKETQIKLHGKVVWARGADGRTTPNRDADTTDPQVPGMGIRFLFNNDSERQAIDDVVEKLMAEALGEHISGKLLARKPVDDS